MALKSFFFSNSFRYVLYIVGRFQGFDLEEGTLKRGSGTFLFCLPLIRIFVVSVKLEITGRFDIMEKETGKFMDFL